MKLVLGSAQFGLNYGITNVYGQVPPMVVDDILAFAINNEIAYIDTAAGYGDAEQILGNSKYASQFKMISKIPALAEGGVNRQWFDASFQTSLSKLGRIDTLLVHQANDLLRPDGSSLWAFLCELKAQGQINQIGFSVYTVEQTELLLDQFSPDLIQFPLNLFDQRFLLSGMMARLQQQGVVMHARSIFLQGLLLATPDAFPDFAQPLKEKVLALDAIAAQFGTTRLAVLLGFIKGISNLDAAVIGVTSAGELSQITQDWAKPFTLSSSAEWAINDDMLLNPSLWPRQ